MLIEIQGLKFTDFGCSSAVWYIKPEYSDKHYVINSQQELEKYISINCIPQIDFSKYILLMGVKGFTTGVSQYNEKIEENNIEIVYTITFLTNEATVAQGIAYHSIIEKPSKPKSIRFEEIV